MNTNAVPPLTTNTKTLYGIGQAAEGLKNDAFTVFLIPYYTLLLGLPGLMTGLATATALIFDAITDPVVGVWSDRIKSRWGRRHPFMYAAAFPLGLCHFLLFAPPDWITSPDNVQDNDWLLFGWLLTFTILTRGAVSLFHVPHLSLTAELSTEYNTRTTLAGLRTMFSWLGGLTSGYFGWTYFFAATPGNPLGQLDPDAYPLYALCGGIGMIVLIFISALGTHHRIPYLNQPPATTRPFIQMLMDTWQALRTLRSFAILLALGIFSLVAFRLTQAMTLPMNTYFWEFTNEDIGYFVIFIAIASVLALIVARTLAIFMEKKTLLLTLGFTYVLSAPLLIILRLLDLAPDNGSPELFYIICGSILVYSTTAISAQILADSMLADVTDEYELLTGERREGIFYAGRSFLGKAAAAIGVIIAGIALDILDIPQGAKPGEIPQETLTLMGLFDGPLAAVIGLIGMFFVLAYPLTQKRHAKIRQQLDAKKVAQA